MNFSVYNKAPVFRRNPVKYFIRLSHKIRKDNMKNENLKLAPDILHFLETNPDYSEIKRSIPNFLLKKYKTPENMYLINKKGSQHIIETIKTKLKSSCPLVEINPGFCFLTEDLMKVWDRKIHLYETSNSFSNYITDIKDKYPTRIENKMADFFAIWKLAFQDKMDQGNRVTELLGDLACEDNNRIIQIIGAMPGLSFMKYLLTTIIFHNTNNLLGRPDLYMIMPIHIYEHLTFQQVNSYFQRPIAALFQLLFDYKVLEKVPKLYYLPWAQQPKRIYSDPLLNEHFMYIVNITLKETMPCHPEYLPYLWYFFKPHVMSKSTRVIPLLEEWIPGCGVWLITGQDPPDTNKDLGPNDNDAKLPHMTIFTQFGDLNLAQKLTVFKRFVSWAEFKQCPFKVTMENNLPKFITAFDDHDGKNLSITHIDEEQSTDETSDNELK